MRRMPHSIVVLALLGICSLLATGCKSDPAQPPCCDWGPEPDGWRPPGDRMGAESSRPPACNCQPNQVCDTKGGCVPVPVPSPGELTSDLVLLRQVSPMDTSIIGKLGKGEADFHAQEPLPADTRLSYPIVEGEKCFFEVGTNYPWSLAGGGSWPTGPGLGAGNLTFTVTGAAGPIVLEAANYSGWAYFHKDTPPHLSEGAASYPDMFDPAYLPAGAAFQVATAGGPDIGVHTLTGGELPADFKITTPPAEAPGAEAASGSDLVVKWSPPQSSAHMEIFITSALGEELALLSCKIRDLGTATIPAAAMKNFLPGETLGLQLRRTTDRYSKVTTTGNKVLHVHLMGRLARLGRFVWK